MLARVAVPALPAPPSIERRVALEVFWTIPSDRSHFSDLLDNGVHGL